MKYLESPREFRARIENCTRRHTNEYQIHRDNSDDLIRLNEAPTRNAEIRICICRLAIIVRICSKSCVRVSKDLQINQIAEIMSRVHIHFYGNFYQHCSNNVIAEHYTSREYMRRVSSPVRATADLRATDPYHRVHSRDERSPCGIPCVFLSNYNFPLQPYHVCGLRIIFAWHDACTLNKFIGSFITRLVGSFENKAAIRR